MSVPYKIAQTKNNEIMTIYVFFGRDTAKLNSLFEKEPDDEIFKDIFTAKETSFIQSKKVSVKFIDKQIHLDDTVETIKKKFMMVSETPISFGEIYLFSQQEKQLDSVSVYQNLTQNGSLELTKDRLMQFLLNIHDTNIDSVPVKDTYEYDDILSLNLEKDVSLINTPIGQKFIAVETTFPYTVNPFDVLVYDSFLERFADKITTTTNHNLLMDTGDIFNNMIYMCSALDCLHYSQEQGLSEESTIKIYFPYLLDKEIHNLSQLEAQQQALLSASEEMISENFERNIENIDMFYNVFNYKKSNLDYVQQGIININFIIHPSFSFNLPLDVVFKLIHATQSVPFIKYNPGKRQEKLYRLYTNTVAANGKKIPYLSKAIIFKLIRTIGKTKRVSIYIHHEGSTPIICEFENNGDISVKSSFQQSVNPKEVDELLQDAINPVIDIVKNYLSQSGYTINSFKSIHDPNIEILNMQYSIQIPIQKN